MKNKNQHIDDTFLAKFLLGETTAKEQGIVISWLEENVEHRKHLDQLEQIWLESGKLKPRPIPVNIKFAWANLSRRIQKYDKIASPSIQKYSRFKLVLLSSVAASALAFIGLFNWYLNDVPQQNEILYANNSQTILHDTLPDGSEIFLNHLAQFSFQTSENKQRIVKLKGDAYFKVKRDTLRPFIVHAGIGGVKVLGTSFQVKTKANGDIAVDVNSGKVELFRPNKTKTDTLLLILVKEQGGIISNQQDTIIRLASNSSAFFWLDNRLSFRNKNLTDIFNILEACYHIKIETNDLDIKNLYYTSSFIDEEPEYIIRVISNTHNLTYTREGDTYTLSAKKNE